MLKFTSQERVPVVLQTEAAECGLACLAMVAAHHGHNRDIASLRRQNAISLQGVSLKGLVEIAGRTGFSSRPVSADLESLHQLTMPCVLHWDMKHFVVLESVKNNKFTIIDPAKGRQVLRVEEMSHHYTGVALELAPSNKFEKIQDVRRVRISDLWQRLVGLKRSLVQLLLLSVILQLFALVLPLFNQIVIDQVIVQGDVNFLAVVAFGFAIVVVIQVFIELIRDYVVLHLTNSMSFQMRVNLFSHLIRLPHEFFQKRHIGDIQARFESLDPVEELLTTTLIGAILDGFMMITTLIIISIYNWQLTVIVVSVMALHVIGTLLIFPTIRRRTELQIQAGAKEQTSFLETIRGIKTIKTFGRETEREATWKNTLADEINHSIRLSKIGMWTEGASQLLFGLSGILVLAVGANFVIGQQLTLGMLLAYLSYQSLFTSKAQALVENMFELKMLGLHLERLADIVHTEAEDIISDETSIDAPLNGSITLENVSYRYGDTEPFIFKDLNLHIDAGDCVSFQGPSGGGKSTLINLMTGLIKPTSGRILIDDQPMESLGMQRLRRHIGMVSQDDTLMSGSIAENISFFDPEIDRVKMEACAKIALIYDEILHMPMRFESLVGDMGLSLSGGQRQRVLLARALYNRPRILIMDEGTANIDLDSASRLIENIALMPITKVFVSHDDTPNEISTCKPYWVGNGLVLSGEELEQLGDDELERKE